MNVSARLGSFYFAYFTYVGALVPYFSLWLAAQGFGAAQIALVLAMPQIARVFAPALWAWLADHGGRQREIIVFGAFAVLAGFVALYAVKGVPGVALVMLAMSVLSAGSMPLVEAATLAATEGRAGSYGPIRLWGSVGFIAAVLAGGAWLDAAPVALLPWALLAFALIALAVAFSLPSCGARAHEGSAAWRLNASMLRLLACGFCMAAAHGTLYVFFTLHLERSGYRVTTIGILWTLGVVAEILVFVFLPQLFRRFSLSSILVASFACALIRFLLLGWLADVLWLLVFAQLLHAATFGAFHAAAVAAVHRVFPEGAQARGQTLFSSISYGAGGAVGALAAGWLWQLGGPGLAFSFSALFGLAGLHLAHGLKHAGV
jgi:PPP family 3-phenylpropionic acid transporter